MTIQARAALVCERRIAVSRRALGGYALGSLAGVVELVDTPALGAGGRKPLEVRVLSPAFGRSRPPLGDRSAPSGGFETRAGLTSETASRAAAVSLPRRQLRQMGLVMPDQIIKTP